MKALSNLYAQLNKGKVDEVEDQFNLLDKQNISKDIELQLSLFHLYLLLHRNQIQKIEELLDSDSPLHYSILQETIFKLVWELYLNMMKNEFERVEDLIEEIKKQQEDTLLVNHNEIYFLYLLSRGMYDRKINKLKNAQDNFDELRKILPKDDYYLFNGLLSNNLGAMAYIQREHIIAIPHFVVSLKYFEKTGNSEYLMKLNNNIGTAYQQLDDYQNAVFYLEEAVKLRSSIPDISIFYGIQFNLGLIYRKIGNLNKSSFYFKQALDYFSKTEDTWFLGSIYQNIGIIYDLRGEVEKALECYNRSLEYFEKISFFVGIGNTYNNIGMSYEKLGKLDIAFEYFTKCYNIRKNQEDLFELNIVIKNLYNITNKLDDPSNKKYYEELQNNPEDGHSWKDLATAKELRKSKRLKSLVQAQEIYSELIDSNKTYPEIKITSLLELSEMLINEYKDARSPEIIIEITSLLKQLEFIAENQNSFWLQTQLLMLKSKLALLNVNINDAKKFISKAQKLAEERSYTNLAYTLSNEYDALLEDLQEIESMIDSKPDLVAELGVQGFGEIVNQVLSKKIATPDFVAEEPILLMILNEGGTAIFSSRFGGEGLNEQLIAGILSAIDSMMTEAFSASTGIERIKQKEFTLLFKPIEQLVFIYVVKGSSYFAMQKLEQFIEKLMHDTEMWIEFTTSIKKGRIRSDTIDSMDTVAKEIFV